MTATVEILFNQPLDCTDDGIIQVKMESDFQELSRVPNVGERVSHPETHQNRVHDWIVCDVHHLDGVDSDARLEVKPDGMVEL